MDYFSFLEILFQWHFYTFAFMFSISNCGCQLQCIFNNIHTNFRLYESFNKHFMIAPKATSLKQILSARCIVSDSRLIL